MSTTLPASRQKLVGGFLFFCLVAIGAALIWRTFGEQVAVERTETKPIPPQQTPEGNVLAVFGEAPRFSLTERSGKTFTKGDLRARPWIANFIFTSCAGQCPLMSLQMRKLQGLFPADTGFRFVSFTVDPERDTPEVLTQYADRYEAEGDRWFFLTGPKEEINRILNGFFLSPVDQPAMHSIRFILVDGEGQMRGYYDSSDSGAMNQLIHDAKILLRTK